MKLSEEQIAQVHKWAAEGLDLNGIQKQLQEQFGIRMTYMDTRFLVMDLGVEFPKQETAPPAEQKVAETPLNAAPSDEIRVEFDEVVNPQFLMSGKVTFRNGTTAKWYVDEAGRLGLDPGNNQPSEQDIAEFQKALSKLLKEKRGLY